MIDCLIIYFQKSRSFVRDRNIELILIKKEEGPYWPHLLKQKVKQHWLKVDFSRWKDEDDSEDEGEGQNQDLEEVSLETCHCVFFLLILAFMHSASFVIFPQPLYR